MKTLKIFPKVLKLEKRKLICYLFNNEFFIAEYERTNSGGSCQYRDIFCTDPQQTAVFIYSDLCRNGLGSDRGFVGYAESIDDAFDKYPEWIL